MAVFLCTTTMFGSLGIYVVGKVEDDLNITTQKSKGELLAMNTALPSLIASIFFFISSIYYGRAKMANEREKEDALTKASQYKFDDA